MYRLVGGYVPYTGTLYPDPSLPVPRRVSVEKVSTEQFTVRKVQSDPKVLGKSYVTGSI